MAALDELQVALYSWLVPVRGRMGNEAAYEIAAGDTGTPNPSTPEMMKPEGVSRDAVHNVL